jgi:hypothetical protein
VKLPHATTTVICKAKKRPWHLHIHAVSEHKTMATGQET